LLEQVRSERERRINPNPRRMPRKFDFPATRRFLHSTSWSSFDDAWSWFARFRVDTVSLRDDRPRANHLVGRARYPSSAAPASTCCDGWSCFVLGGASPCGPRFSTLPADGRPPGYVLEHREHPPGRPDSTAPKDLPRSRPNRLRRAGSPVRPKCPGFAELSPVNHIVSTGTSSNLSVSLALTVD
jgi:hypothetical protein